MFCSFCGSQLNDGAAFCSACGKTAPSGSRVPDQGRVAGHLRLLGVLWLTLSAFRLLPGALLMLLSGAGWGFLPQIPGFVPGLVFTVGGLLSLTGVAGIVAGWGLLARAPWARILTIVVACLGLLDLPFGTALGVYTLWVLLPEDSAKEYGQMTTSDPPGKPVAGQTPAARVSS